MVGAWMTYSLFFLFCFPLLSGHSIKKRSILQFGLMIKKVTGKAALDFNNYGHYCGLGGSGKPVDKIDSCCMIHDKCYGHVDRVCSPYFHLRPYFSTYNWSLHGNQVVCDNEKLCNQMICFCDSMAVNCFNEHLSDYNPKQLSIIEKVVRKVLRDLHFVV